MLADTVWTNARLLTMSGPAIDAGAIAARDGRIVYAGSSDAAPGALQRVDCAGRWITPGLVDCHTHLVFGGNRAGEFEQRLAGISYADIAASGGGIVSSVRATRAADEASLIASATGRLDRLLAEGVTTIEIKSGYGLDLATERRMLRAARALDTVRRVSVVTSFLGAHALPPEATDKDAYIDHVCAMLPDLAREGLVDAVDAFCETIAFSPAQTARVFAAARTLGLPVKLHADQLSNGGGAVARGPVGRAIGRSPGAHGRRPAPRPWPAPARSPSCCQAPSTCCAKPRRRTSPPCDGTASTSPWPPTATPAPRR